MKNIVCKAHKVIKFVKHVCRTGKFLLTLGTFYFINFSLCVAQQHTIDSIRNILKTERDDTNKVNTLNTLSSKLWRNGIYDTSLIYANHALTLATKLGFEKGLAGAYSNIGVIIYYQGDYIKSLDYSLKELKIDEELKDQKKIAKCLSHIGLAYFGQGNYTKGLDYYLKSLKMAEELNDKSLIAILLGNIGLIYYDQGDYTKSLDYYFKALKMATNLGDKNGISSDLGNIGLTYWLMKDYDKALDYDLRSLKMDKESGNPYLIATGLGNIGSVYADEFKSKVSGPSGNLVEMKYDTLNSKALTYYFEALKMEEEIGDKPGIARQLGNIGGVYTMKRIYKEAEKYLLDALKLEKEIGNIYDEEVFEESISELYEKTGSYQLALENDKKARALRDTIYNAEKHKEITRKEVTYEFERRDDSIAAEQEKANIIRKAEIKRKNIITESSVVISVLTAILALLYINRQQLKRRKDKMLFEKNLELSEQQNALLKLEKQRTEDELANAKAMLDDYIKNMMEKNELLEQFKIDVENLRNLKAKEIDESRIVHLESLNKATILTEEDWNKFKELFEQAFKGFFIRLKEKLPDLTQAEIRLVCLTKLKLDTKQMAGILGVSADTIKKTRYRLRKKLGLSEEGSIDDIAISI
ncbi:MAG: tetratricopeptide repeat protein [Bacteroidia bacterium]